MAQHSMTLKTYYTIFAILMILLVATVLVAYLPLGPFNVIVAMSIAVTKAVLVILYFMHVKFASRLTWVFVIAGFYWLLLLIGLTMTDYVSRDWLPVFHG